MTAPFSFGAAAILLRLAQSMMPAPETAISEWVDEGHIVLTAKTNTPRPGRLTLDGVEYIREPLDCLHPDHPARRVPVIGGAQSAKSLIGQCWCAYCIAISPRSFAIGLPSDGEVGKYNDYKLQPIIEDSPALQHKVRPVSTKTSAGSSARKKNLYSGHSILIFNLNSPKELQMISTGNLLLEETANTNADVGGRGDPIKQARERQSAYSVIGAKECMVSTPGVRGECAITKAYEAGDQRRYYGECQHCKGFFNLEPEGFQSGAGDTPHHFVCPGCGCLHEEKHNAAWRKAGRWVPTFKAEDAESNPQPPPFIPAEDLQHWIGRKCEGRDPSYYVWQAMCGLISWDKIATSIREAKTTAELKALEQQTFGRAWDPSVEALSWEELVKIQEPYVTAVVPSGAGLLTGFCDVQARYLQWSVYGWGPGSEWWVVARDIIQGDTGTAEPWLKLAEVVQEVFPHEGGGSLAIDAFGVDTGYQSQMAYNFVRGRHNCYALDGRPGWGRPFIAKGKMIKVTRDGRSVGQVRLYPTGTWPLKSALSASLQLSIAAGFSVPQQGRGHWSKQEDDSWCQQMTAEVLEEIEDKSTGQVTRTWKKLHARRNEELDIWVGSRALAWMLGVGAPKKPGERDSTDWAARAEARTGRPQGELFKAASLAPTTETTSADAPTGGGWNLGKSL